MAIKHIIILVAIVLGLTVGFVSLQDLSDAGVEDYDVKGIRNIGTSGFNVDMELTINSPAKLPFSIDGIDYTARLRETGEVVARGTIEDLEIPKGTTTIEISPRIDWIPGSKLLLEYATEDEVWMDLELNINILRSLPLVSVTIPVDVKEVFDFAERNPESETILEDAQEEHKKGNFLTRLF